MYGSLLGLDGFNNAGHVAFSAELTGAGVTEDNDIGIWSDASGSMSLIAREGSTAVDTSGGDYLDFYGLSLNNAGQTAFRGYLVQGTGDVTADNDRGIWATDPYGQLQLIVREGDWVDVHDDPLVEDLRMVLQMTGNLGKNPFNDAGQLAYKLDLTDGLTMSQGIFVATVPEPASIFIGLMVCVPLVRRCR